MRKYLDLSYLNDALADSANASVPIDLQAARESTLQDGDFHLFAKSANCALGASSSYASKKRVTASAYIFGAEVIASCA